MDSIDNLLNEFDARLRVMRDSLNGAPAAHAVEVGTAVAALSKSAEELLNVIKETLRKEALARLGGGTGTVQIDGTQNGQSSITVPVPKLKLGKDADPELLKKVLGDDFSLYFETVTTIKPRPTTRDLVVQLPDGPTKTILLSAVEETQDAPRVSFKRK